ncbi:hypothetical protein PIROE2DRAFT_2227 [Piromyces sp. E2]|nr:hypothetical protein PIROE2DRAFT_2227 [Piromyces sp. E2]|eukprot:OUM69801.1 hypothetical protein PIROE2DRAFT_2227 [Piromyces sp. E2]
MKFITPFFAYVAATAVLAYPQNEQNATTTGENCDLNFDNFTNECVINESFYTLGIDQVCSTFKSDKCKEFYSTFNTKFAKCSNAPQDKLDIVTSVVNNHKNTLDLICEDENKKCPFFQKEYKDRGDQAINDTCKSKNCILATLKAIEINSNSTKVTEGLNALRGRVIDKPYNTADSIDQDYNSYMLYFLKSEYCNAQSSDAAATMKYSMVAILLAIAYALF